MKPKPRFQNVTLPTIPGLSPTDTGAPEGGFILSVRGKDASGKSDLACRAPGVIGYYSLDAGADRVVSKHRGRGAKILLGSFEYDAPPTFVALPRDSKDKKSRDWWKDKGRMVRDAVMDPWLESWRAAYRDAAIRTMVMDTATEAYEMMALAHFGKLQQNERMEYGALYADFLGPIKKAKQAGKLVILLHQVKEEYGKVMGADGVAREERTGRWKRAGCAKTDYVMDAEVETRRIEEVRKKRGEGMVVVQESGWEVEILRCKHDPEMAGTVMQDPSFQDLMEVLKPGTDPGLWA